MFYTDEEVSVITGLLNAYLAREHASEKVRESYTRIRTPKPCTDEGRLCLAGECAVVPSPILVERPRGRTDADGCPPAYADTGTENVIKIDEGCIARYTLHFLFGSIPCFTSFEHLVGDHRRADEIGRINFQCIRNIEEHQENFVLI